MEEERKSHDQKMKKMEQEMEQVFEMKVKERNQRIIDSENDVSESTCRAFVISEHLSIFYLMHFPRNMLCHKKRSLAEFCCGTLVTVVLSASQINRGNSRHLCVLN